MHLDEFHYHEAIDRTDFVRDIIDTGLEQHPVFHEHKHLAEKLGMIQDILGDIYQDIGNIMDDKFENKEERW